MGGLRTRTSARIGRTRWVREGWSPLRLAGGALTAGTFGSAAYRLVTHPHGPGTGWWVAAALGIVLLYVLSELIRREIRHRNPVPSVTPGEAAKAPPSSTDPDARPLQARLTVSLDGSVRGYINLQDQFKIRDGVLIDWSQIHLGNRSRTDRLILHVTLEAQYRSGRRWQLNADGGAGLRKIHPQVGALLDGYTPQPITLEPMQHAEVKLCWYNPFGKLDDEPDLAASQLRFTDRLSGQQMLVG